MANMRARIFFVVIGQHYSVKSVADTSKIFKARYREIKRNIFFFVFSGFSPQQRNLESEIVVG